MSSWETIVITAVIAAFAGIVIGAYLAGRSPTGGLSGLTTMMRSAITAPVQAALRRRPSATALQTGQSGRPAPSGEGEGAVRAALTRPGTSPAALAPLPPTVVRRGYPAASFALPAPTREQMPRAADPDGQRWLRSSAPEFIRQAQDTGPALLRVSTMDGDIAYQLPEAEGLRIGPELADIVVPEMDAYLLLGRSGFVWTVQLAGPASQAVIFDGIPLTTVAMPWTSDRVLTAGRVTLTLENAPAASAWLEGPATDTAAALAGAGAAQANAFGLAIGIADSPYASLLTSAAMSAFDSRLLDPARGAALAALNATLAVQDARRVSLDTAEAGIPRIAVVGGDGNGELRAAANFDVSVWAITQHEVILLSGATAATRARLDVVSLDIRPSQDLGERPLLLLAAGASSDDIRRCLAGASSLNARPRQITQAVTALPKAQAIAAAAVLIHSLRASAAGRR